MGFGERDFLCCFFFGGYCGWRGIVRVTEQKRSRGTSDQRLGEGDSSALSSQGCCRRPCLPVLDILPLLARRSW